MGKNNTDTFISQLSDADLADYLTDTTAVLRSMCQAKDLSALAEVYGFALNLLEKRRPTLEVSQQRMTG